MTELSVQHFKNVLDKEIETLNGLCERWSQVLEENNNSEESLYDEDALGAIRTTVGQAHLLLSKKFKQFSELISNCEFNTGQLPTRLDDLSGFWDMVKYQVDDVLRKFKTLDELTPVK